MRVPLRPGPRLLAARGCRATSRGLTIYRGDRHREYLLVSSQGDDTFAVYDRAGKGRYLGSFAIGDRTLPGGTILDGVQESDGAHVVADALPGFPHGLFVTQDGDALDLTGEEQEAATNFKYVRWDPPGGLHPR